MQALHANRACGGVSATATQRVRSRAAMRVRAAVDVEQLKGAKKDLAKLISDSKCNPIIVRLGWHDAGTYDDSKKNEPWPIGAGATGSIRYLPELEHAANSGLAGALELLNPIHEKYPNVSFADMYQMASAVAIEVAGGPKMEMRYGRADVDGPHHCAQDGFLPSAGHPFPDGSKKPGDHLRKVFYRMGFNDQEIVALSGAHTLGRSRPERSGWGKAETKYTKDGPGKPGGQSWTVNWLHFDNSYFTEVKAKRDAELLVLPTDAALYEDEGFRPHAEKYAADEKAFFEDYAKAHVKLSELGVKWVEGAPVAGI